MTNDGRDEVKNIKKDFRDFSVYSIPDISEQYDILKFNKSNILFLIENYLKFLICGNIEECDIEFIKISTSGRVFNGYFFIDVYNKNLNVGLLNCLIERTYGSDYLPLCCTAAYFKKDGIYILQSELEIDENSKTDDMFMKLYKDFDIHKPVDMKHKLLLKNESTLFRRATFETYEDVFKMITEKIFSVIDFSYVKKLLSFNISSFI